MTTDNGAHAADHDGPLPPAMAELFAQLLTTEAPVLVAGKFVHPIAFVNDYGEIVIDITRISFTGDDRTERVTLMPTTPVEAPTPPGRSDGNGEVAPLGVGEMDRPTPPEAA